MSRLSMVLAIVAVVLGGVACRDFLLHSSDPEDTPENNFEILWQEFDHSYSFFKYKKIDWNAQYSKFRPQVDAGTSPAELFGIMSEMVDVLKDGHVSIYAPFGTYRYDYWKDRPENFNLDLIIQNYIRNSWRDWHNFFITGDLDEDFGYVHIRTFGSGEQWETDADEILEGFKDKTGLVIDVRNNGGGDEDYSQYLAARFADQKRLYCYVQWRNGPGHGDFSAPEPYYVEPSDKWRFSGPVVLLTNRHCYSTTEAFVLSMRIMPQVTLVGDVTGGGSGNPIARELPNGWVYRLSRWIRLTPEKGIYEGIGLLPDLRIDIAPADEAAGRDTILDAALQMMKARSGRL